MKLLVAAAAFSIGLLSAGTAAAGASDQSGKETDSKTEIKSELSRPVVRGAIVYKYYCTLCHGEAGDGLSRAKRLHEPEKLAIGAGSATYYEQIIRMGGAALGKSPFMPVWQDELSDEQIADVVAYLGVVRSPIERGEAVFKANCILCHGVRGDGKGRASILYNPPPADLTRSDKNDMYKEMIITLGGKAMGRSDAMPIWGGQISEQEIKDLVVYLRTLLVK